MGHTADMLNVPSEPLSTSPLADAVSGLALPPSPLHFDELRGQQSAAQERAFPLAPHWVTFFDQLGASGLTDLDRRAKELANQVRDNGVTYNVYADHDGPQRPWTLDLFPLIMTPESWLEIEAGVQQRARLLECIMDDVYGPQELIKEALIPPALIHGHPGYVRAMHGAMAALNAKHLHIVAFDLARGPDNKWAVVSQRTQAPSGLGYLLENRLLVSRHFPNAFEALRIQPLATAYWALIESLKRVSYAGNNAHIALLTPGPYNETYFEHAYLARTLGLTLVEGHDLVVRDQQLFLRTLRGLEPVHVLLKRLDDEFLDPLELRPDSTLGVPGLLQAVRAGNVVVANAPGSAFLESPGLLGFLPALSQKLLGETLQLPAMDTWWCGEQAAMQAATARLAQSVIKPTYPPSKNNQSFETTLGSELSPSALDAWAQRIAQSPDDFTVQAHLPLAQMPTWQSTGPLSAPKSIVPRSFMLRVFVLRDGPTSWRVLPGGLARVATQQAEIASMQRGGSSADVWVQGSAPGAPPTTLSDTAAHPPSFSQRQRRVTSRAAESLYWLGRYTERSENALRLARLCLETLNGEDVPAPALWAWLLRLSQHQGLIPADLQPDAGRRMFERTLILCLNQQQRATSVGFNLAALQRAASVIRERLSPEQWNTIVRSVEMFNSDCAQALTQPEYSTVAALQALSNASHALAAITGAQTDRMTRDDGWQLLSIGRHIERLGFLSLALTFALEAGALNKAPQGPAGFTALLNLFDSTITFRAQHQQSRELAALVDLLIKDKENPRSLNWVAGHLRVRLSKLAGTPMSAPDDLTRMLPTLDHLSLDVLCQSDAQPHLTSLQEVLVQCLQSSRQISDGISAKYFSHTHVTDYTVGT
jgi:uncharacterized circularly permuted ATP-grasp superfamily protein/uncharacterized alpha-E superfamily protein